MSSPQIPSLADAVAIVLDKHQEEAQWVVGVRCTFGGGTLDTNKQELKAHTMWNSLAGDHMSVALNSRVQSWEFLAATLDWDRQRLRGPDAKKLKEELFNGMQLGMRVGWREWFTKHRTEELCKMVHDKDPREYCSAMLQVCEQLLNAWHAEQPEKGRKDRRPFNRVISAVSDDAWMYHKWWYDLQLGKEDRVHPSINEFWASRAPFITRLGSD